jgi:hypothetical protein
MPVQHHRLSPKLACGWCCRSAIVLRVCTAVTHGRCCDRAAAARDYREPSAVVQLAYAACTHCQGEPALGVCALAIVRRAARALQEWLRN